VSWGEAGDITEQILGGHLTKWQDNLRLLSRFHDRRPADQRERFTSVTVPPYLKRTKSLDELIPWGRKRGSASFPRTIAA